MTFVKTDINKILDSYVRGQEITEIDGNYHDHHYTHIMNTVIMKLQDRNVHVDVLKVMTIIDYYYTLKHSWTRTFEEQKKIEEIYEEKIDNTTTNITDC